MELESNWAFVEDEARSKNATYTLTTHVPETMIVRTEYVDY